MGAITSIGAGTFLVRAAPSFEVSEGLIHAVGTETGIRFALTGHICEATVAGAIEALNKLGAERGTNVAPACRMCPGNRRR